MAVCLVLCIVSVRAFLCVLCIVSVFVYVYRCLNSVPIVNVCVFIGELLSVSIHGCVIMNLYY